MDLTALDAALESTLDDLRLSRSERRALGAVLGDLELGDDDRRGVVARAFAKAKVRLEDGRSRDVLGWLEEVVKLVMVDGGGTRGAASAAAEALFSPGEACRERIVALLRGATRTADICVFTITDNRIARAIVDAHRRGVRVRVITDDDKAEDRGSDIEELALRDIPVVMDRSPYHMHHKFALFDGRVVLTGSYNWTRGAAEQNEENLVVATDARLVEAFQSEFDALWERFGGGG